MCGIAGSLGGSVCNVGTLQQMASTLSHRGPDDEGLWFDPNAGIGLVHRRLSILDLSRAGHQPMSSPDDRYVIVFNGEIYNHLKLRTELEQMGQASSWCGHSDTETLLACFLAWGIEVTLRKTVGMFAFAMWDKKDRTLTLARDRLGEKPLYYGWQGNTFLFGSELKALKVHPEFRFEINRGALSTFMRYSYIPAPQSIYRDIYKLFPGTLLTVCADDHFKFKPVTYWSLHEIARQTLQTPFTGTDAEALQELETRLSEAVALQQISDVPLGTFLSGGIDSSTIVALMQAQATRPVHTYTIGFEHEKNYDEAVHARVIARHLGTNHEELYVTPEEARAVIPKLATIYDEPFADSSQIPTFLISQMARLHVTVSLSGDAGDELFGGYNRYFWIRRLLKLPSPIRRLLATGIMAFNSTQLSRIYEVLQPILPATLRVSMPSDKVHKLARVLAANSEFDIYQSLVSTWPNPNGLVTGGNDVTDLSSTWKELTDLGAPENIMMALDAMTYLPDDILCKVDRAAMGVSLETRMPFLDHRVVEFAWRLPLNMKLRNGQGKWILRQLLYKYVPKELVKRPKMGFGVPIDSWLRGPLRDWAEDLLSEDRLKRDGFFHESPIRSKWAEHLSGRRNWQHGLWNVLMFQAWLEANRH